MRRHCWMVWSWYYHSDSVPSLLMDSLYYWNIIFLWPSDHDDGVVSRVGYLRRPWRFETLSERLGEFGLQLARWPVTSSKLAVCLVHLGGHSSILDRGRISILVCHDHIQEFEPRTSAHFYNCEPNSGYVHHLSMAVSALLFSHRHMVTCHLCRRVFLICMRFSDSEQKVAPSTPSYSCSFMLGRHD